MVIATTPRVILRRWQPSDRQPFATLNADPRVTEFMPATLSHEESDRLADRIEAHFQTHGFGLCAVELSGTTHPNCVGPATASAGTLTAPTFIGFIGLSIPTFQAHFTPCIEIGWRLSADHWGQGLATEGAQAIIRYAFDTLNVASLVSFTVANNARSRRVMEKLGMTRNPADDFNHPDFPPEHPLSRHILYRLSRPVA